MAATTGSYTAKNGKTFPTLTLKKDEKDKFGLTMGVSKAKLVLSHLDEIRKFVASAPAPTQGAPSDDAVIVP